MDCYGLCASDRYTDVLTDRRLKESISEAFMWIRALIGPDNIHNKKLEAFCKNDNQLVCINCVLMNKHKSHEVSPIPEAAEEIRGKIMEICESTKLIEKQLVGQLNSIMDHKIQLPNGQNMQMKFKNTEKQARFSLMNQP